MRVSLRSLSVAVAPTLNVERNCNDASRRYERALTREGYDVSRTVLELVAILSVATGLSVVALFNGAILLSAARVDLKAIREAGIGNGRLAAARGEHRLAWARFLEALICTALSGVLIYAGIGGGDLSRVVGSEWTLVAIFVGAVDALIMFKGVVATQTRSRIFHLAEHGDLSAPKSPNGSSSNGR